MPKDAQWLFRYDTMTAQERFRRYLQERKFYTSLPRKLDQAEKDWHRKQQDLNPKPVYKEEGTFGQEGWSISYSHPSVKKDD